jgi:hypothetical protein
MGRKEIGKILSDTSTFNNINLSIVPMLWNISMVTMGKPIISGKLMLITCAIKSFYNHYFRYDI